MFKSLDNLWASLIKNIFAVPIATFLGIPLYTDAAGIIPIAGAYFKRGRNRNNNVIYDVSSSIIIARNIFIEKSY